MRPEAVGMYVHTHWAYRHPYAARTWTLGDWRGFLSGLKGLGFTFVQVWPMLDIMPLPLTASDRQHLERLARVVDLAHDEFGMKVIMGACANTIGNDGASRYGFEERPYFTSELRLNPGDPTELERLFAQRREAMAPLAKADGFWVIDSDPGGYEGSTTEDFVRLLGRYRQILDALDDDIELVYWVWWGWPHDRKDKASVWREALSGLKKLNPEPWAIHICMPEQVPVVEELGLTERGYAFRYHAIENEPSLPWTRWDPEALHERVTRIQAPRGRLGNAQTHSVQLPHIYCFSHFAKGGTPATADLAGFAERLLPRLGARIASAWKAMAEDSAAEEIESALGHLERVEAQETGDLGGLLLGGAPRFLGDLRCQLRLRRVERMLQDARELARIREALGQVRGLLAEWRARTGFNDFGWVSLLKHVQEAAKACGEEAVVGEFNRGSELEHRHHFMDHLLERLAAAFPGPAPTP